MSKRDYTENHTLLLPLEGRQCFLTVATNAAKLHIDKDQKNGTYIWIDPPWSLTKNRAVICSPSSYPDPQADNYKNLHEEWCSQFDAVRESRIESIEATEDGALRIEIEDGFAFEVPADTWQSDGADDWYDHWYVESQLNSEQNTTGNPLPR